jgi:nucleotide-binding universal stress UspA family protein
MQVHEKGVRTDIVLKPGWSKPSAILLATETPSDEKTFAFALDQSAECGADLIIFHAIDTGCTVSSQTTTIDKSDEARAVRTKKRYLEPLAQRAKDLGIRCRVVVRVGSAADQILTFLRERNIDRVVIGAHSPGPVGKLLVGSVTEAVLRKAIVPVCVVGPDVVASTYRSPALRNILCDVSTEECRRVVAIFAAELAAEQHAGLILEDIIRPQEKDRILADRTINQIENELPSLVPAELQENIDVRTKVAFGDPTEELLHGGRARNVGLIVLGAMVASRFAAITRAGIVYKVLAYARCPVITLSPVVLADFGVRAGKPNPSKVNYVAGVV